MKIEEIARICHDMNRAYCAAIGDKSQLPWEQSPEWQKESAVNGVKAHLDNPNLTHEESHENWMEEKIAHGWVYGPFKDPENKLHPCIIEHDLLALEHRVKDVLFKQVVDSMREYLD